MSSASSFKSQIQAIRDNEKQMGDFAKQATDRLSNYYHEKQLGNQDGRYLLYKFKSPWVANTSLVMMTQLVSIQNTITSCLRINEGNLILVV